MGSTVKKHRQPTSAPKRRGEMPHVFCPGSNQPLICPVKPARAIEERVPHTGPIRGSPQRRSLAQHTQSGGSSTGAHPVSVFAYKKLQSHDSIRVLDLLPGSAHDPLECRLYEYPLGQKPCWPQLYEAVSYVWGSIEKTGSIICNDAICINQDDILEKNQLVSIMDKIYEGARTVLFCLDGDISRDTRAMKVLNKINNTFETWLRQFESRPEPDFDPIRFSAQVPPAMFHSISQHEWEETISLLSCDWWSRAWVLQEFGLAYHGEFLYGRETIDGMSIELFVSMMAFAGSRLPVYQTYHSEGAILTRAFNVVFLYKYQQFVHLHVKIDYLDILQASRTSIASVKHDYIYATLGHQAALKVYRHDNTQADQTKESLSPVQPDYAKRPSRVFKEASEAILTETGNLRLVSAVEQDERTIMLEGHPSWVPRWDTRKHCITLGDGVNITSNELAYNASSGSSTLQRISVEGDVLMVRGFEFDEVVSYIVSVPFERYGENLEALDIKMSDSIHDILTHLHDISSPYTGQHPKGFTNGLATALGRTLTARLTNWSAVQSSMFLHGPAAISDEETLDANFAAFISRSVAQRTCASQAGKGDRLQFLMDMQVIMANRQVFTTKRGFLGIGPRALREGDICCILFGAMVPIMLRRKPNSRYVLVGESYVHGIMQGETMEAFREGKFDMADFGLD
ncbi:heterokaryon incompatibility protein 6, OR allele [Aspergillus udagawae]|uniref:Heterokaryon incompatibility protein 6, OR allele n=1 Tax=Aspergillus udagawae TaxID=91492 RepID=A0A8H3RIJ9_9EURO|nr:heterokaryon incompatibility protein 6, OR allele [Aspergillus udagawae]